MGAYEKIYLANNLDSLNLLAKRNFSVKRLKFKNLCNALSKLYKESQCNVVDQEKTYILLLRYIMTYETLLATCDDKKFVEIRFGSEYEKVKAQFQEIMRSLERRYTEKSENAKQPAHENVSQDEKKNESKSPNVFNSEFINCRDLVSALQKNQNILLVDARPDSDFSESKFENGPTKCINVPDHCINSGLSANVLGKKLPEETQKIWDKRDSFDVIVLYDWNTTAENFPLTKLDKLRSALVDWDLNRNYKEKPVILNGGYLEMLQTYPTMCHNPLVLLSKRNNELDELLEIDEIEYPTESDNRTHVMPAEADSFNDAPQDENEDMSAQEIITTLRHLEGELKKTNDLCKEEENIENLSVLEEKKDNLQEKISNFESILNDLNVDNEQQNSKMEINDEKSKILDAISEERLSALKKARALKPKNSNNRMDSISNFIKKPSFNRATKPIYPRNNGSVIPIGDIGLGLVGLRNIRNTCYLNTVIQCFRNVPYMKDLFCLYFENLKIRSPAALIYETANLIRQMWSKNVKYIEPYDFYSKVCTLEPTYKLGNHEDCMEFFLFLLNHLNEDCCYDVKRPDVMTPKQKAWYNQFQGKNSPIIDSFYHEIRIRQNCNTCGHSTYKFEIESTFMLSVPDHEFELPDLLRDYMADFIIPEYCCARCKKPVHNHKEMCYEPEVMVIVLKRYKQNIANGQVIFKKVDSPCYFPQDGFKLGNYHYRLNSIAMHSGDMNFGHYTAACLTPEGWYEFNDETVRPININDDQIKVKACAFFYTIIESVNRAKWG